MTVVPKPSHAVKKTILINGGRSGEEIIDISTSQPRKRVPHRRYRGAVMCMGVIATLLLLMGLVTAMQIYEQVMNDVQRHNRYQGFCSIPLSRDIQMLEQRKAPLRWKTTSSSGRIEPEVQVISILNEDPEHIFDLLREVLDIDIDDGVEKISVVNNGHPVTFVHDFEANVSGIVDAERCFTMELDPSLVLKPESLLTGLQQGAEFDVSRVRSQLHAALPALRDSSAHARALRERCADLNKPTYALQRDDATAIRKRSVDAPPHDFMQFAGKRIQEIEISNLAELLEYEQKSKLAD